VQRFVQDYQSRNGSPPAPFAAEGYDAASRILDAIEAGNTDRASIDSFISSQTSFDGLAGSYRFDANGFRTNATIEVSQDRRGTWVVVDRVPVSSASGKT
jgi:branched-chain amino acid transport system substrate-binding protein